MGCKVTLRREGLDDFMDLLSLTTPRREKLQAPRDIIDKFFKKSYFKKIVGSLGSLGDNKSLKEFKTYSSFAFTLGELVLFYPIELGLGLHADVQRVQVNFRFSTPSIEERFFLRRYNKVPVLS